MTIKSATLLATKLTTLTITNSSGITIQGFTFGPNTSSTYAKIVNSTNIKILRNVFDHKNIAMSQSSLVTSQASDTIEIAYNQFRDRNIDQSSSGVKYTGSFIKTQWDAPNMTKNLWLHHNHFKNITPYVVAGVPAGDSDRECIAMGIQSSQDVVTNNIVEYNLFEDCDGENEIITVKTSNNTFRYNTFLNSMGSLSLRLGSNQQVYGNYFFGSGASTLPSDPNYQTGGIRVYGSGHKIYNNYMQGLTGTSWRQALFLDNGDTSDSTGGDSHEVPSNTEVSYNTVVDSASGLAVGSTNYSKAPLNNKIYSNLIVGSSGAMVTDVAGTSTNTWGGNIVYPTGSATAVSGTAKSSAQVNVVNPSLVTVVKNGYSVKTLSSGSAAINAGQGGFTYVTKDIDGENRSTPDVGADEYSASPALTIKPLTSSNVGPAAP